MSKKRYTPFSLGIFLLLIVSSMNPVFAEVTSIQIDSESIFDKDQIYFSGTVEENSNGLVSIVIRDFNDEFIMLAQALINPDYSFEKIVPLEDKFPKNGMYNATGFILSMANGATVNFEVSSDEIQLDTKEIQLDTKEIQLDTKEIQLDTKEIQNNELVKEIIPVSEPPKKENQEIIPTTIKIADFVDSSINSQHYVDRYYNEQSYKSWFDRNYPNLTIEQAVGIQENIPEINTTIQELINADIIPEVEALVIQDIQQPTDDSEIAQILVAIAALGVLFGTVYAVKRNVDNNSRQISINKDIIRKKIIQPILGSNPVNILQTRLAKGEITLEEYEKIKSQLS